MASMSNAISSSGDNARPVLSKAEMARCIEVLRVAFDAAAVISRRKDCIVIRSRSAETGDSIVIKMWSRTDLGGRLRRLLRIASVNHEWRNLTRMRKLNIAIPRPLGVCRAVPSIAGFTDVLFMEDLGPCTTALEHLKALIRAGQEPQALGFENELIELTARILEGGMLDADHGMLNIVVTPAGRVVRLDVEIAQHVIWPRLFPARYGSMLGRLIGLHAFAVQPDVGRTTLFAERLSERLRPPPRALRRAGAYARELMQKQLQKAGIDTQLILPREYL